MRGKVRLGYVRLGYIISTKWSSMFWHPVVAIHHTLKKGRKTERQKDRKTERQKDRKTEVLTEGQTERETNGQINKFPDFFLVFNSIYWFFNFVAFTHRNPLTVIMVNVIVMS